jgi:predicted nuclease of predicted toxin-antitoxin system
MKFLFDENFSPKLVKLLADLFPGSVHVRDAGLNRAMLSCGNMLKITP